MSVCIYLSCNVLFLLFFFLTPSTGHIKEQLKSCGFMFLIKSVFESPKNTILQVKVKTRKVN